MRSQEDTSPPIRVVLADDHALVRHGIKALLQRIEGVEVIAEAADGHELLALLKTQRPDVVMTDLSMPGLDGIAATAEIARQYPEVRVIVLSMYDTVDFVRRAVANGASGYLMKDAPSYELEQALRGVIRHGRYFSAGVAQLLLSRPGDPAAEEQLTPRQVEILTLLAQGKSTKEIAFDLGLSSKTVDVHRARIMARLKLGDLASLTRYALRKGLVSL